MTTAQFVIGCVIALIGLVSLLALTVLVGCWVAEKWDDQDDQALARELARRRRAQERAAVAGIHPRSRLHELSNTPRRRSHAPGPDMKG